MASIFDKIGGVFGNIASGVGDFVGTATKFSNALNPINTAVTAISGLFDNKNSGIATPQISSSAPLGAFSPPPVPVETTTGLGTGNSSPFQMGFFAPNNQGSGGSLIPRPPVENQNSIIETPSSSINAGNFLAPIGTGLNVLGKATGFFNRLPSFGVNYKIPAIGDILGDDDNRSFSNTAFAPDYSNLFTDYDISKATGDFMAYGVGGQGALQIPQAMPMQGSAFMSPVLGRIGISSRGNIIITRRLKNQFKALADNVGLAQASNLAGVPLEIGAMILTKRFSTRGKSISTKKMRDCARTYRQITNFYNMIPKRTATRSTKRSTMRGASTVIQNS